MVIIKSVRLVLALLLPFACLQGKEIAVKQTIPLKLLVREVGVAPSLLSGSETKKVQNFLVNLQSEKSLTITIWLDVKQGVIDKTTPVKVEIENGVLFSGEKYFKKGAPNAKKYTLTARAVLLGEPSISDISPSEVKDQSKVTIYVPLYGLITQSIAIDGQLCTASKNVEILNSVVVATTD